MFNLDKRIQLAFFHSYCAHNVFCLTFGRNLRVFVERNWDEMKEEWRSDKAPQNQGKRARQAYNHVIGEPSHLVGPGATHGQACGHE